MERQKPETRTVLLDAAEALFSRRGYAAVGIREIVEKAGANLAAIQYHFGGKAELYREMVRRAMERRAAADAWAVLDEPIDNRQSAADALATFIHLFLRDLLSNREADIIGSLILQEAAEPTDAIEYVVRDFTVPHEEKLARVIAILQPECSRQELSLHAQSVLGQILHYRTYRPFLERMAIGDLSRAQLLNRVARHIAVFTLQALGCTRRMVETALERIEKSPTLARSCPQRTDHENAETKM